MSQRRQPIIQETLSRAPHHDRPPQIVSYIGEDAQVYELNDLEAGEEAVVPKRRAGHEPFPPMGKQSAPGATLLRLSGYALFGALLGGMPGVALGAVVALIALARVIGFNQRARNWRKRAKSRDASPRLPARATSERLRLVTAFWQSLGAVVLGGAVLTLLFSALR